jgi:hypothetical protein
MLYPIELLRHSAGALDGTGGTASMLTATLCFVMSPLSFSVVVRRSFDDRYVGVMQNAMLQDGVIAKCNPKPCLQSSNYLI